MNFRSDLHPTPVLSFSTMDDKVCSGKLGKTKAKDNSLYYYLFNQWYGFTNQGMSDW